VEVRFCLAEFHEGLRTIVGRLYCEGLAENVRKHLIGVFCTDVSKLILVHGDGRL